MIALADLCRLLVAGSGRVRMRTEGSETSADFALAVAGAAAAIRAAGRKRVLLVAEDCYWFAVGFFGALHAGAELQLPPNGLPETLRNLDGDDALFLFGPRAARRSTAS